MEDWEKFIVENHELDQWVRFSLVAAIQRLLDADRLLLKKAASERAITHRLALHLTPLLPDWDVDCEYNINGDSYKRLIAEGPRKVPADPNDGGLVYPDIIIHRRGRVGRAANLLVIEVKKLRAPKEDIEWDVKKLEAYQNDKRLEYQHALFLHFGVGPTDFGKIDARWH